MLDTWLTLSVRPCHGHNVKASRVFQEVVSAEITEGRARDPALFVRVDRFDGMPGPVMTARLDFDEDNRPAVDGDKIDLADSIALAAAHDNVTQPL